MSSKFKIIILTLIITLGFLGRDTVTISGPVYMVPTYIAFFASLVLSFVFIILTENRKTHNHSKMVLATVNFFVSLMSIILAYFLDMASYRGSTFSQALQTNMARTIDNITNYGYIIILLAVLFGILAGSSKNLRTTYSYKSSKHITGQMPYKKYSNKR